MASSVRKRNIIVVDNIDEVDDLIGEPEFKREKEESIDDLLGEVELPDGSKKLKVQEGEITAKKRIVAVRHDLPMGYFRTKQGQEIIAPVTRYWVVRDSKGKLWYKEESGVTFLPANWQKGDPIPGWSEDEQPKEEDTDDLIG